MSRASVTPFDTIESAQDFVRVFAEAISEAKQEIGDDLARDVQSPPSRRTRALQIAIYNLDKLEKQMARSRRILNDLRSLRRMLFAEREFHRVRGLGTDTLARDSHDTPAIIAAIPAPKPVGITVVSVRQTSKTAIPA